MSNAEQCTLYVSLWYNPHLPGPSTVYLILHAIIKQLVLEAVCNFSFSYVRNRSTMVPLRPLSTPAIASDNHKALGTCVFLFSFMFPSFFFRVLFPLHFIIILDKEQGHCSLAPLFILHAAQRVHLTIIKHFISFCFLLCLSFAFFILSFYLSKNRSHVPLVSVSVYATANSIIIQKHHNRAQCTTYLLGNLRKIIVLILLRQV